MHHAQHHHLHEARQVSQPARGVTTAVSVVYVTATPSFSGTWDSYSTESLPSGVSTADSSVATAPSSTMPAVISAPSSSVMTSQLPSSIVASTSGSSSASATSSSAASTPTNVQAGSDNAAASSSAAAPSATAAAKSGLSAGAAAGLAIGLLALAVIAITAAFFIYRARKAKRGTQGEKIDDEKSPFGGPAPMTSSVAPRLSLGNNLSAPIPAVTRGTADLDEKANPFGDHARLPEAKLPALADPALAPKPLNVSRPGTPTRDDAPADGPRSTSPTSGAPINVHRVVLDFNPSMEDELELRQGQVVRLLHEYDDGWCLCIRLDRSQQGVVPRSCVSKAPVKPRQPQQAGPGNAPPRSPRARSNSSAPRPAEQQQQQQGPFGEGQYRARSSTVGSVSKPASIVSTDQLSNSPGNNSPERTTSPTLAAAQPAAAAGPGVGRKPVPGQAV